MREMKFKKIMLITLLLAVLTIGAVSAADDADALAVEDAGDDVIGEAPAEDDVASGEDSDTLMDDSGALPDEDYIIGFGSDN
ncbi:MAG: hypothetical protein J6S29_02000, partial [Methanosphaera sp.]|nr:hypothetical protein [Methanosphaera sp.]